MTAIAVGTDGGGSIRIPAALTGLVGVKAQFGRVPVYPTAATPTLAHVCPIGAHRSRRGAAADRAGRLRPRDPSSVPLPAPDVVAACGRDPRPLRIAWSPTFGYAPVDPEVRAIAERRRARSRTSAARWTRSTTPFGADSADLWTAEFYAGIGARLGPVLRERPGTLDPDVAAVVERATAVRAEDYYRAVFGRYEFRERVRRFFEHYDLLLSPTLPVAGVDAGVAVPPALADRNIVTWVCYTYPFNLTGQPAASVPAGFLAGLELDFGAIKGRPLSLAVRGWIASLLLGFAFVGILHVVPQVDAPLIVTLTLCTTGLGVLMPVFRDGGELETSFGRLIVAAGTVGEVAPIVAMSLLLSQKYSTWQEVGFLLVFLAIVGVAAAVGMGARPPRDCRFRPADACEYAIADAHFAADRGGPVRAGRDLRIRTRLLRVRGRPDRRARAPGRRRNGLREKMDAVTFGWFYPFFFPQHSDFPRRGPPA